MDGWWGDASNIYFGSQRVEDIDVATFQYLGFRDYAKDANHIYYKARIIEGADVESFEILGSKYLNCYNPQRSLLSHRLPLDRVIYEFATRGRNHHQYGRTANRACSTGRMHPVL